MFSEEAAVLQGTIELLVLKRLSWGPMQGYGFANVRSLPQRRPRSFIDAVDSLPVLLGLDASTSHVHQRDMSRRVRAALLQRHAGGDRPLHRRRA